MTENQSSGAQLIAVERRRQIASEGYDAHHDARHNNGELAQAAAVYASPRTLYAWAEHTGGLGHSFMGMWPHEWDYKGTAKIDGAGLSAPTKHFGTFPDVPRPARIRELAKAGALIAAEIDRLLKGLADD